MKYKIDKKLGSGAVSDAYLLDNGKVIIIGKREDSFSTYKALYEKMKHLIGKITALNYPKIYELISPCKEYPFGAMIEEYIEGEELRNVSSNLTNLQKFEIGRMLAKFISQIHNINSVGNKEEEININLSKFDKSLELIKKYLDKDIYSELAKIKYCYKNMMEYKDFCTTHSDLNAGNIMIDKNGKVSGIIDFGNLEYYISEIEFVHMYFFDRVIYNSMVENYNKPIDEKEVVLLELIVNIRHFKNIVNFNDKRIHCLNNIEKLLKLYLTISNKLFKFKD